MSPEESSVLVVDDHELIALSMASALRAKAITAECSGVDRAAVLAEAVALGANAWLSKTRPVTEIVDTVVAVFPGERCSPTPNAANSLRGTRLACGFEPRANFCCRSQHASASSSIR